MIIHFKDCSLGQLFSACTIIPAVYIKIFLTFHTHVASLSQNVDMFECSINVVFKSYRSESFHNKSAGTKYQADT